MRLPSAGIRSVVARTSFPSIVPTSHNVDPGNLRPGASSKFKRLSTAAIEFLVVTLPSPTVAGLPLSTRCPRASL
jgi:hypothetical protein